MKLVRRIKQAANGSVIRIKNAMSAQGYSTSHWRHTFQLAHLSRAELLAVLDATVKQTHHDGHVATVVTNIETLGGIAA